MDRYGTQRQVCTEANLLLHLTSVIYCTGNFLTLILTLILAICIQRMLHMAAMTGRGYRQEVGQHHLCRYRYNIDIHDPKYRRYQHRYPLLQRSLAYSYILLSPAK